MQALEIIRNLTEQSPENMDYLGPAEKPPTPHKKRK